MRWIFILLLLFLPACSQGWESTRPEAPPGGVGLSPDKMVEAGPQAVSSVSQLPAKNKIGPVSPFGSKGIAAAYEYKSGYRIGAGDRLAVRVAGEPDLSAEYIVDASGVISLPYVQNLSVSGLSTPEIEKLITMRLRQGYLRDPKVSVQATSLRPFYILGEVTASGSFAYQPGITVQNAIAIAGGYSARADQGNVLITRKDDTGTQTIKVPVTTQLYPGDIIFVRERWF